MSSQQRYKTFCAVYLVLLKNSRVLLLQRRNTGYNDGNFSLPAGHLDDNETLTHAVIREAKEEVGVTTSSKNLVLKHIVHRKSLGGGRKYLDFYFIAKAWVGTPCNLEPEKCSQIKWFPLRQLPKNMVPEVRAVLTNLKSKNIYSEFGWKNHGTTRQ